MKHKLMILKVLVTGDTFHAKAQRSRKGAKVTQRRKVRPFGLPEVFFAPLRNLCALRETLSRSQVDHVAGAPDVCGDRAWRRGGQKDCVVMLNRVASRLRQLTLRSVIRRHQRESPQTAIQLLRSRSEWSNVITQHQPHFRALVDEVLEQRRRLHHATLESLR